MRMPSMATFAMGIAVIVMAVLLVARIAMRVPVVVVLATVGLRMIVIVAGHEHTPRIQPAFYSNSALLYHCRISSFLSSRPGYPP